MANDIRDRDLDGIKAALRAQGVERIDDVTTDMIRGVAQAYQAAAEHLAPLRSMVASLDQLRARYHELDANDPLIDVIGDMLTTAYKALPGVFDAPASYEAEEAAEEPSA